MRPPSRWCSRPTCPRPWAARCSSTSCAPSTPGTIGHSTSLFGAGHRRAAAASMTWHAGHVKEQPPPWGRFAHLLKAAERRHVPLLTILVTVAIVAATYLAGLLIYRIRTILLLILVAGFVALLLNPIVNLLQRRVFPRRGAGRT